MLLSSYIEFVIRRARKRPAGFFRRNKNAPDFFKSWALNFLQRGTTLVRPPVTRTTLKASNKAAAGNGATRPVLLKGFGQAARGPVIHRGSPPARTDRRLSEGDTSCLYSRHCI